MSSPTSDIPNALALNPMAMQALAQLEGPDLMMFLMGNQVFVPEFNRKRISSCITSLTLNSMLGLGLGLTANVLIKRVSLKVLQLPLPVRLTIRLGLLGVGFLPVAPRLMHQKEALGNEIDRLLIKLIKFRKTGNIQEYFKPK